MANPTLLASRLTPTVPPSEHPLFDDTAYRELFAPGDPAGRAWLEYFLSTADALMAELQALYATNQREALARAAHNLAGTAHAAGAERLGATCRALEQAASRGSRAAVSVLTAAACAEFRDTLEAVGRLLEPQAAK